jgi:hypothetical protein
MVTNLRAAGVELQFSRNDVQGRRVVSVVAAAQILKTPSVAESRHHLAGRGVAARRRAVTQVSPRASSDNKALGINAPDVDVG